MVKLLLIFFLLLSCKTDTTDEFYRLIAIEKNIKENNENIIFNPDSALLISVLPTNLGDFKTNNKIRNYESKINGSGYSKDYFNKNFKDIKIIVYSYHNKEINIDSNINNNTNKAIYENIKKEMLNIYDNSKIISENTMIFTNSNNNNLVMKRFLIEYKDLLKDEILKSHVYFGIAFNTYFRIKITYNKNIKEDDILYENLNNFIKDFSFYLTTDMSLNEYNNYKKLNKENLIKVQVI